MLDRARILEKIEAYRPASRAAYRKDDLARAATERALQVAIEASVDTAALFVSGLRLGLPDSESGVVRRLDEEDLIAPNLVDVLDRMRGFRNVLVHQYGDLDDDLAFEHAERAPEDIRRLADAFRDALREHGEPG